MPICPLSSRLLALAQPPPAENSADTDPARATQTIVSPMAKLPPELIGRILNHILISYFSRQSPLLLASLMQVNRCFLGEIVSLLTRVHKLQSGWIEDQMQWSLKKIRAIAQDSNLNAEQVRVNVEEKVLKKIQHVRVELTEASASMQQQIKLENGLAVLAALAHQNHLQSLDLKVIHSFIEKPKALVAYLIEILTNNSTFSQISLHLENNHILADHLAALGKPLSGKHLLHLTFIFNPLGDEGISILAAYFPKMTVRELQLRWVMMTDQGLAHLTNAWPAGLRTLSLKGNDISNQGIDQLLTMLTQTEIERVNLNGYELSASLVKKLADCKNKKLELIKFDL